MTCIQVAIDVPLPTLFDYRCDLARASDVGCRVRVPFGRKRVLGIIVSVGQPPSVEATRLRQADEILRDVPPLPPDILRLLRFCSAYYHHPIGEVVLGALPSRYRAQHAPRRSTFGAVAVTAGGRAALRSGLKRSPALARLLEALAGAGSWSAEEVRQLRGTQRRGLKGLLERGWASTQQAAPAPGASPALPGPQPAHLVLTPEQQAVLAALLQAPTGFRTWLLHGVTGSGKTEIYLRIMAATLDRQGQVLLLVPEIGLTPQLEARLRARFPQHRLVTLHSNLASAQRASNWISAHAGEAQIVLGTRSAVFTPMPRLALIIVDEEHDASFKQVEGMRYCARDLAIWRAQQCALPVVLGSATPSLESYRAALSGRYRIARLTQRASGAAPPDIRLVAASQASLVAGIASLLLDAIAARVAAGEQALVYLNRRGFAPVLVCAACGWAPGCTRCSARLVLHKPGPRLMCHHCGHAGAVPAACEQCGNVDLHPLGFGTQRIESTLRLALPAARVLRIDRDTTRGRNAWSGMRESIERREVDVLVGTQLLSKGHDFAGLGLVCVLNSDQALYSTDFRAAEQLFAQLMQVSGRAGRAGTRGEVLIQTAFPSHPLYRAVQAHDYDAFARMLLEERRQAHLPPFVHQAVLRAEAPRLEQALSLLHEAAAFSQSIAEGVVVYDPAPATMQRLKGRERAQLLVQSASRPRLHAFLERWARQIASMRATAARWAIDVDPISI
ncbi:MAG: primosomal protein N' [Burkholderiales bacterium]|nr:primosomal protein N' [Burkholderiales bacterium]